MSNFFFPDLVEVQRQSFFYFLEKGLSEEFLKRNPITSVKKDIEIFFYPEFFQLKKPKYDIEQAILKNRSYSSRLYIPVQLTDRKRKRVSLKWVLIGHLPLMTKRGHFLLNGSARVIVNQIVRSPGVYFQEKLYEIYDTRWSEQPDLTFKRYYADIICLRGTWLRIEIDKEKRVWAQMKKLPKIPILWLLMAMGLNEKEILSSVQTSSRLLENFKPREKMSVNDRHYNYVNKISSSWKELSELLSLRKRGSTKDDFQLGRSWVFKRFMNPRNYDLGKYGRIALNSKLGLTLSIPGSILADLAENSKALKDSNYSKTKNQTTLTAQDLLSITDYLLKVEQGFYKIDDIDHLKNRRVRTSGDLIQSQFAIGLTRLEKWIREKLLESKKPNINYLINTRPVNGALKEFFGTNPLSQFMDQLNPLSEITHKRRLSSMGYGGVTRENATMAIRGIHPSHYGRICPIETPEGKNTGLVNSLTVYARVNSQGLVETPFLKVYSGQIQKQLGLIYFSANQEEKTKIAATDLAFSPINFLSKKTIPARIENEFVTLRREEVDFVGSSPLQMISLATSLIPFLEHDDANRALMGSNMQRQAVPLIRVQRPVVGTGSEARSVSDSSHALTAKYTGFVVYTSGLKIILYTFKNS